MTRARIDACGSASAIAGRISAFSAGPTPASQPGKAAGREPAQPVTAKTQHQQHREPEVRHRDAELRRAHDADIGRACRAARPPRSPTGRAISVESASAISASGSDTRSRSSDHARRPGSGRCRRCRNRRAACRRPSRDSARAAGIEPELGCAAPRPPPGLAFMPSMQPRRIAGHAPPAPRRPPALATSKAQRERSEAGQEVAGIESSAGHGTGRRLQAQSGRVRSAPSCRIPPPRRARPTRACRRHRRAVTS